MEKKRESLPKSVLPHTKKLVIGSKRNPPLPEQTVQRRAPLPIPQPLPEQQCGERRKLSHSCYSGYIQGCIPGPGRNLLEEVCIPFCGSAREFQYDSCEAAKTVSSLDQDSFLLTRSAFLTKQSRVCRHKARLRSSMPAALINSSPDPNLWGLVKDL